MTDDERIRTEHQARLDDLARDLDDPTPFVCIETGVADSIRWALAEVERLTRERNAYEGCMVTKMSGHSIDPEIPWWVRSIYRGGEFRTEADAKAWLRSSLGLEGMP